jgi:DNA (cytosine-5)-methyltransferase 1
VGAIELDRFAAQTYRRNFPTHSIHERSVTECSDRWLKSKFSGVDVVVGGPPCQGFSVAGPAQYGQIDRRNALVLEMARVVRSLRPRVALLENVKGILAGKLSEARKAIDTYVSTLEADGYISHIVRLQAADYGVPQNRERVFVISTRDSWKLTLFVSTLRAKKTAHVSAGSSLSDLPSLTPGGGSDALVPYASPPKSAYQRLIREGSRGVANHVAMKHTPRMVARLKAIPPGGSLKDVPAEHGQRARNSATIDAGQRYKMNCSRIDPHRPAIAVPANFQTIHVHPHQHRMLTAREGARLQGFPDSFVFMGPRTLMSRKLLEREGRSDEIGLSQYNQIGNAVPPPVASSLGLALVETMFG